MGFHPDTGVELLPATKEVAAASQEQSKRRPPKLVDWKNYELFDPLTGEPRVWYWRSEDGNYEFYDNDGYHPPTGERLISLSREAASKIVKEAEEREKKLEGDRQKQEVEAKKRAEQIEQDRQRRLEQEANAKKNANLYARKRAKLPSFVTNSLEIPLIRTEWDRGSRTTRWSRMRARQRSIVNWQLSRHLRYFASNIS
jgi:hypothetical protein